MARKPRTGPASDPELLILSSLASGPKHGYAIMSDVETFAGIKLGPGTLYTAITRLVEKKLIAPAVERRTSASVPPDRERRHRSGAAARRHAPRRNDWTHEATPGLNGCTP